MKEAGTKLCGVLAMQGDYAKHIVSLERCQQQGIPVQSLEVRTREELECCDSLIIPGGESTTMYRLLMRSGLWEPLMTRIKSGLPVFGTCAGMILLGRDVFLQKENEQVHLEQQPCLGAIDLQIVRNFYGRQISSFRVDYDLNGLLSEHTDKETAFARFLRDFLSSQRTERSSELATLKGNLPLIFIRAPKVKAWGEEVEVLLRYRDEAICLQQGKILVASFHPELSESTVLHEYFLGF